MEVRRLRMFTLKFVLLTFVTLLDLLYMVKADICPSGLECDYHEYCCGDVCCSTDNYGYGYGYGFYNLWYFWFVIIMIMMTCCGACSYVKKRQYYLRQQQGLGPDGMTSPHLGVATHHHPPATYGVHPNMGGMGPPVGTFPGPPAYNEVTEKPDQFPKADYGYPNFGFAAPPYSPPDPNAVPQTSTVPPPTTPQQVVEGATPLPYPPAPATTAPCPAAIPPEAEPMSAPPPYTPSPQGTAPTVLPAPDQSNPSA